MRLTQRTDIALRALIYLACNCDGLCSVQHMAKILRISSNHLQKVMQELARHRFVETRRGKGGGHRLAFPADEISVGDVVRALEPIDPVECFRDDNKCMLTPVCALAEVVDRGVEAFMAELDDVSLADLANVPMQKRLVQLAMGRGMSL